MYSSGVYWSLHSLLQPLRVCVCIGTVCFPPACRRAAYQLNYLYCPIVINSIAAGHEEQQKTKNTKLIFYANAYSTISSPSAAQVLDNI